MLPLKVTTQRWENVFRFKHFKHFTANVEKQSWQEDDTSFVFATEMEALVHFLLLHLWQGNLVSVQIISLGQFHRCLIYHLKNKQKTKRYICPSFLSFRTFVTPDNLPTVLQYFAWAPNGSRYASLNHPELLIFYLLQYRSHMWTLAWGCINSRLCFSGLRFREQHFSQIRRNRRSCAGDHQR